jgi:hypothetical protein
MACVDSSADRTATCVTYSAYDRFSPCAGVRVAAFAKNAMRPQGRADVTGPTAGAADVTCDWAFDLVFGAFGAASVLGTIWVAAAEAAAAIDGDPFTVAVAAAASGGCASAGAWTAASTAMVTAD